jgi:hypothetical protein
VKTQVSVRSGDCYEYEKPKTLDLGQIANAYSPPCPNGDAAGQGGTCGSNGSYASYCTPNGSNVSVAY